MSAHRHIRPHGLFFLAFCTLGTPMLFTGAGCSNEAQASPPTQPGEVAETPADQTASSTQPGQPGGAKPSSLQYNPHDSLAPLVARVLPHLLPASRGRLLPRVAKRLAPRRKGPRRPQRLGQRRILL